MAAMSIQTIDPTTGLTPSYGSVNSSDTFANDGKTSLHVKNGSGASVTVTITSVATSGNDENLGAVTLTDLTFSVGAGAERILPFLKPARFNDGSGNVTVGYSATSSVTAAAVKFQRPL